MSCLMFQLSQQVEMLQVKMVFHVSVDLVKPCVMVQLSHVSVESCFS